MSYGGNVMKILEVKNGITRIIERDITLIEVAAMQDEQAKAEAYEAHRPLSADEVTDIILRAQINTVDIPDDKSVRMKDYYPTFAEIIGQTVKLGYKFTYGGELYKTAQPDMTIQAHYPPGEGTESLYSRIDETHIGNKYDPIPYDGNMALMAGLYYTQDGVVYLCTRDTINPVYNALADLVGIYVDVVR